MSQKQDHASIKLAITGISGSGKTTLLENLLIAEVRKLGKLRQRFWIFVFDHKDGDMARRFGVKPCRTKDELNAAVARNPIVIFDPGEMFPGDAEAGFDWFCKYVWSLRRVLNGVKIVVADELDALVDTRSVPYWLCVILDQGRTFQFDCYFICQATNAIHNQVRKQFREIFVMMQGDKNGLTWLLEKGFDEAKINSLTNGQWLYKNLNTSETASGGKAFTPKNASRDLRGL
jgi:hypothetical protein